MDYIQEELRTQLDNYDYYQEEIENTDCYQERMNYELMKKVTLEEINRLRDILAKGV